MKTDSSFSNDISRGGKIQSHRTGFTAGLRRSRYGSYEKYRASGGMLCRIQPREHQRESWCVSKNRMFSESTAIGSSPIVDYSSTDGSVEAQEIVDGGNIEEKNTFSKASRPCRMAYSYVDPSSIIGKHHHPCIALLLLDTIYPTARPGQHRHLGKMDLVFAPTSCSISKPNSDPAASPSHTLYCP